MVRDSLRQRWAALQQAIHRHRALSLTAAAAGSLTLVLISWLVIEQGEQSHAGDRPSLIELLDQVSGEQGRLKFMHVIVLKSFWGIHKKVP